MNCYPLLLSVLLPLVFGAALLFVPIRSKRAFNALLIAALAATLFYAILTACGGSAQVRFFLMSERFSALLSADGVSKLFLVLFSAGALFAGLFALEYMAHEENAPRFFSCFLLTLSMLNGLALSGNLVTMYLFFELATLCSMPLVLFERTAESVRAAGKYLFFSIAGGFAGLFAVVVLSSYCTFPAFVPGGGLDMAKLFEHETLFSIAMFVGVVGFGAKAGLFPLHGWLFAAHPVAPAPASALLSGIVAKAGLLAIVRLLYFAAAPAVFVGTWMQTAWILLALFTVFMGSMMACREDLIKKRLAFSTISQISYALFGVFLFTPEGLAAGLLHAVFHACIKICLFLSAGAIMHRTGRTRVSEMDGVGREMPVTMWSYTLASLALIGIPPFCGFVSKWYLAKASLAALPAPLSVLGPAVLLLSALLTAYYLLPVVTKGFFPGSDYPHDGIRREGGPLLTLPVLALGMLTLLAGMFPGPLADFLRGVAAGLF